MAKPKRFEKLKFSHEMRLGYEEATALFNAIDLLDALGIIPCDVKRQWNPITGLVIITWSEKYD